MSSYPFEVRMGPHTGKNWALLEGNAFSLTFSDNGMLIGLAMALADLPSSAVDS